MILLLVAALALLGAKADKGRAPAEPEPASEEAEVDFDRADRLPTIEDLGYFLSRLDERRKSDALNILMDLAADSRLPRHETAQVFDRLLDEGSPPDEFGYGCPACFQKRLSNLLQTLRMRGPKVAGPETGYVVMPVNERLIKKITKDGQESFGGSLPAFVKALLDGYDPSGSWTPWSYARYHGKGADVASEPVFFSSAEALAEHEASLREPLDAWSLARYLCIDPPRNRYDPGFLLLEFEVSKTCNEVRIPTAADCEQASFRPTAQSEVNSGRTCGGAPEWVCPNFPLSAVRSVRFVANGSYVRGMR